jgi:hypothetical protein
MKVSKLILGVVLLVLVGGIVGCGADSVTLSEIPVYPGAEPLATGENQIADPMVARMELLAGQSGLYAEMERYAVPAGATWNDIRTFYEEQMSDGGWTPVPDLTVEEVTIRFLGWSRGEGERQQSLVVGYVPAVGDQGAFMVLGVFSKQQG